MAASTTKPQKKKPEAVKQLYPIPSFKFTVKFSGGKETIDENSFQEVSGLTREMQTEEVIEGGENSFTHKLPKGMKYPNLVLKRGVVNKKSTLHTWIESTFDNGLANPIVPMDITVSLLDEKGKECINWSIKRAYPVKWELSTLNGENNQLLVETIELAYTEFKKTVT